MDDGAFGDPPSPSGRDTRAPSAEHQSHRRRRGPYRRAQRAQMPYAGTGFMVAEDVVMTNCHVARMFCESSEGGDWSFQPGLEAVLDFVEDPETATAVSGAPGGVRIDGVIGIHPALDLALLRVTPPHGPPATTRPLTLMAREPASIPGRNVYVIGYPAPDHRNDRSVLRAIFGDRYFVKRLQPGVTMALPPTRSSGGSPALPAPSWTTSSSTTRLRSAATPGPASSISTPAR